MVETILQSEIAVRFIYPFLLIFFIVFAILEKSKLLGDDKKQVNAFVALVIGLIFVSVSYPKLVVENMILFLTIAIVVVFVVMIIWGFIMGGDGLKVFEKASPGLKWVIGIAIIIAVTLAVLWATGVGFGVFDNIFGPDTKKFWTNAFFVGLIALAMAVVLGSQSSSK